MLSLKHLPINTFNEHIAYLHKDCQYCNVDNVTGLKKVEIQGGMTPIYAFLQITEDESIVSPQELALNTEAFKAIGIAEGSNVSVKFTGTPQSFVSIKRKIAGNILNAGEYTSIINETHKGLYSNIDIASFLVGLDAFMTPPEVLYLTEALIGSHTLHWDNENMVVDFHSIGGVPGNKVDILATAIVSAYGLPMPLSCSKSYTSCAGVGDVFEVLANIDIDEETLSKNIKEVRGAIVRHHQLPICVANKTILSVEKYLGLSQLNFMTASALAVKIAMGVSHLVVDIPVGEKCRVKSTNHAMRLRKLLEYVGDMIGTEIDVVITDGSEPIGNGLGAVLEARDVMKVLRNKEDAPKDLREKALFIAGRILEFDPNLRGGQGYAVAQELLDSGAALKQLNEIIYAQGKAPNPQLGSLVKDVVSDRLGVVDSIDNKRINKIGVSAGAAQHPGAGIDLFKKVGDRVDVGDVLYRIHSVNSTDFAFANTLAEGYNGYVIKN